MIRTRNMEVTASIRDFQDWLNRRKQPTAQAAPVVASKPVTVQPTAPIQSPQPVAKKVEPAPAKQKRKPQTKRQTPVCNRVLEFIQGVEQCTSEQAATALNLSAPEAGNRLRVLKERGLVKIIGRKGKLPMFALVDNPQEKRLVCRIKDVSIRERVLEYFQTHATGTNLQISQALGYVIASSVSTATARMVLDGELVVAEENIHPTNGKVYRIFKLGKVKEEVTG